MYLLLSLSIYIYTHVYTYVYSSAHIFSSAATSAGSGFGIQRFRALRRPEAEFSLNPYRPLVPHSAKLLKRNLLQSCADKEIALPPSSLGPKLGSFFLPQPSALPTFAARICAHSLPIPPSPPFCGVTRCNVPDEEGGGTGSADTSKNFRMPEKPSMETPLFKMILALSVHTNRA